MALGRRRREQRSLPVATTSLPQSPGHPCCQKLNQLLEEAMFDKEVEALSRLYYADGRGRPGIPPGVCFRMLFVGYFEGLDLQRAIAWRCHDSRSLQSFLGYEITDPTPEHSSLTVICKRLPLSIHEQVFAKVLAIVQKKRLLKGKDDPADKGYHSNDNLTWCQSFGIRTYIPERESPYGRRWSDKSEEEKRVVYNNRRRVCGKRGKQLGRLHSEYTERSFAHVCETGGARRSRLRGLAHVFKRYLMCVAARNLGVRMRALFNMGTPKGLQTEGKASLCAA